MRTASPLNRKAGVALWRQIAARLEAQITAGEHPPGSRLPTEAALAERFGVNRHTLRRAMAALEETGLVQVEQGRGTFVRESVVDYRIGKRTRFRENLRGQRRRPAGDVLDVRELEATREIASALRIRPGTKVVHLVRLGYADGRPIALASHYFPGRRFASMLETFRRQSSITAALREAGVVDYTRESTRVVARLPSAAEQRHLGIGRSRPVLVTESVNVDADGKTIEYGVTCFAGDRVQLVLEP